MATPSGGLEGIRVLVVDDEADSRDVTKRLLTTMGATVETAADAVVGFQELQRINPDVLICDIGMPDEDGLSFIKRVRKLNARAGGQTPALALTAYARAEDRIAATVAGFQMHASKPIEATELAEIVYRLANREPATVSNPALGYRSQFPREKQLMLFLKAMATRLGFWRFLQACRATTVLSGSYSLASCRAKSISDQLSQFIYWTNGVT